MDEARLEALIQTELDTASAGPGLRYEPLSHYLEGFPPFNAGPNLWARRLAGGMKFGARNAAAKTIEVARKRGSARAGAAWLLKVLAAKTGTVRLVLELGGIEVTGRDVIVQGMTLTSPERLPRTDFAARMVNTANADDAYDTSLAYLYQDIERSELWTRARPQMGDADEYASLRKLASRIAILRDASPVVLRVWSEHLDPDLDLLFGMTGWGRPGQDAAAPWYPEPVTPEDQPTLERLYELTGRFSKVVDIALHRINLGRRRISPGEAAIDAAIALEALLGDPEGKQDMTYKLRLRTALFLGDNLANRATVSDEVKALYNLRSKIVHGGEPPKGDLYRIATRGSAIVREVLHKLIDEPALPDWPQWELAGGDPARFATDTDPSASSEAEGHDTCLD